MTFNPELGFDELADAHVGALGGASRDIFLEHPYHHAVDSDHTTFYYFRNVVLGDYFGLDLFYPKKYSHIYLKLKEMDFKRVKDSYVLEMSLCGSIWVEYRSVSTTTVDGGWTVFELDQENHPATLRFFRFKCTQSRCVGLNIAHLSVTNEFAINF